MREAVIDDLVVDFVGANDQLMLARDFDDALEQVVRIKRTGRVVRIDHDDGARIGRNLGANIVKIGQPAAALVTDVMHRRAARERYGGGPQRIVGRRHQHFVAIVEQPLHGHHDQLGGAIAEVDVVQFDAGDMFLLRVMHDRLARGEHPFRIGIACRRRQVKYHVLDDFVRRVEAERCQVTDIEFDDPMAFLFEPLGLLQHGPSDVVAHIEQLVRFLNRFHGGSRQ